MNYGKDLLKVDDLLRGFGSIHSPVEKQDGPLSPPFSPKIVDNDTRPAGVMLRDFGPPGTQVATSDTKMIDCGYGQARHV